MKLRTLIDSSSGIEKALRNGFTLYLFDNCVAYVIRAGDERRAVCFDVARRMINRGELRMVSPHGWELANRGIEHADFFKQDHRPTSMCQTRVIPRSR